MIFSFPRLTAGGGGERDLYEDEFYLEFHTDLLQVRFMTFDFWVRM